MKCIAADIDAPVVKDEKGFDVIELHDEDLTVLYWIFGETEPLGSHRPFLFGRQ